MVQEEAGMGIVKTVNVLRCPKCGRINAGPESLGDRIYYFINNFRWIPAYSSLPVQVTCRCGTTFKKAEGRVDSTSIRY